MNETLVKWSPSVKKRTVQIIEYWLKASRASTTLCLVVMNFPGAYSCWLIAAWMIDSVCAGSGSSVFPFTWPERTYTSPFSMPTCCMTSCETTCGHLVWLVLLDSSGMRTCDGAVWEEEVHVNFTNNYYNNYYKNLYGIMVYCSSKLLTDSTTEDNWSRGTWDMSPNKSTSLKLSFLRASAVRLM